MALKIKISKAGFNVLTETNPNNQIFDSDLNTFKILSEGKLTTQSVNANPKTFTLAHNLGYTPSFYGFAKFPDGKATMPDCGDFTTQYNVSSGYGGWTIEADSTNLYFIFTRNSSDYNVDIKWYIFEAPI